MKIPPILLKLLHNSATKARPNYNNNLSKKGDGGFTLLEVLIVVVVLGIFASIAAPGWLGFINRQRVRTVNDRVLQSLRLAQSEAKRTKRDVKVTFHYDTTLAPPPESKPIADPPKVMFDRPLASGGSTQPLGAEGEIKPGQVILTFSHPDTDPKKSSIVFDYQGKPDKTQFIITVSTTNSGTKQCAIVETLIGGMRTAEGTFNPTTKEGCP